MAKCSFCNSVILFGGKSEGSHSYCGDQCVSGARLLEESKNLIKEDIDEAVNKIHTGRCPLCRDEGPVDVHTSYRIWSAVIFTNWEKRKLVCCRPCGIKAKVEDFFFSIFLGWWGIPFGLIGTPIQLFRNISGIFRVADSERPSDALREFVAINLAAENEKYIQEGSEALSTTLERLEESENSTTETENRRRHRPSDTAPVG